MHVAEHRLYGFVHDAISQGRNIGNIPRTIGKGTRGMRSAISRFHLLFTRVGLVRRAAQIDWRVISPTTSTEDLALLRVAYSGSILLLAFLIGGL